MQHTTGDIGVLSPARVVFQFVVAPSAVVANVERPDVGVEGTAVELVAPDDVPIAVRRTGGLIQCQIVKIHRVGGLIGVALKHNLIPDKISAHSLHVLDDWNAAVHHHQYLSEGQDDPRRLVLEHLVRLIHPKGSIIAYNARFEIEVLNPCCAIFPDYLSWWESIEGRFVDLLQPFRNFDYYAPGQHGSGSMKAVLPALCGVGYEDLAVQDGTAASQAFLRATFDNISPEERERIRKDLEAYCGRDTEGMISILRELKRLVES